MKNANRLLLSAIVAALLLAGCSISTKKSEEKKGEKVDIKSAFGSIHVETDEQARAHDTGLPVYPGARPAPSDEHDKQRANVDLGFAGYGLRVIAVKYESDDPPAKLLDFYRKELGKYGHVEECKGDLNFHEGEHEKITCKSTSDDRTELGVGDGSTHRGVSIKPKNKGAEFGLFYVQTRGKERETM
jgi:outer membrane murein-binding lipoprotein Lpp